MWLKFRGEERPFGIPIKEKRSHSRISAGDIIQVKGDRRSCDTKIFGLPTQVWKRHIEGTLFTITSTIVITNDQNLQNMNDY
ncbi:MAG: hypothetical protein WAM14_03850 [Candidatus Nitrosopolaris sp.]